MRRPWLFLLAVVTGPLPGRTAAADDAGGGSACPETAYGMPCDPGDGNACGGLCLPDFSKAGRPMACLAATADALARAKLTSLDGIDCAPAGPPGTDCAHACSAGACVATNAPAGAACMPAGVDDSGIPGLPVTVCSGACDGAGRCPLLDHGCDKYGRGELDFCLYTACNVASNAPGCVQFASPAGAACSTEDPCITGETCSGQGLCTGGARIANCSEPNQDASLSENIDGSAADGALPTRGPAADTGVTSGGAAPTSSKGCSTAGGARDSARGLDAVAPTLLLGWFVVAALRRRLSRAPSPPTPS